MLSDAGFCAEGAKYHYDLTTSTYIMIFSVQSHVGNCFKPLVIVGGTALEEKLWRDGTRKKIELVKNNKHYINSKSIIQFKEHIQIREAYKKDWCKSTRKLHSKKIFSAGKSHALLLVLNFTCGEKNNEIHPKIPFFQAWKISQVSQLRQNKKIK